MLEKTHRAKKDFAKKILSHISEKEIVAMVCDLVNIPSPTGEELEMGKYMRAALEAAGLQVTWQEVEAGRANVVGLWEGSGNGKSVIRASYGIFYDHPLLGLYFRDAYIYSHSNITTLGLYCVACTVFSLISLLVFRVGDGVTSYFSVHDALDVLKAVVLAELMTCIVLFSLTRLEGIPRSTPIT